MNNKKIICWYGGVTVDAFMIIDHCFFFITVVVVVAIAIHTYNRL